MVDFAKQIDTLAIILCATIIYELVGPVITKIALTKAGEIEKEPKVSIDQKIS